jgi:hypothetical protein
MSNKKIQGMADNWLKKREEKRKREIEEASVHKDEREDYLPVKDENEEPPKKPRAGKRTKHEERPKEKRPLLVKKPKTAGEADKEEYSGS